MSKHINMTGHYKVAGRERQGEDILQSSEKGAYAQQLQEARREAIESQSGPPAWETTPPNLEIPDRSKPHHRRTEDAEDAEGKADRNADPQGSPEAEGRAGNFAAGSTFVGICDRFTTNQPRPIAKEELAARPRV